MKNSLYRKFKNLFNKDAENAWFSPGRHNHPTIAHSSQFIRGFLARVPRFVWRNIGLAESPYPPLDAAVTQEGRS